MVYVSYNMLSKKEKTMRITSSDMQDKGSILVIKQNVDNSDGSHLWIDTSGCQQ